MPYRCCRLDAAGRPSRQERDELRRDLGALVLRLAHLWRFGLLLPHRTIGSGRVGCHKWGAMICCEEGLFIHDVRGYLSARDPTELPRSLSLDEIIPVLAGTGSRVASGRKDYKMIRFWLRMSAIRVLENEWTGSFDAIITARRPLYNMVRVAESVGELGVVC